jgi:DNA polymerase-3 subunit epsilon
MLDIERPWTDFTFVAFDTETSGAYPLEAEIVEFGAVKWRAGKEVDSLQFLLKPSRPMSDFIIGIHGITNEMVAEAPLMNSKIQEIKDFCEGTVMMAHHAPFDLGFLALDFEKNKITPPSSQLLCTSLLARKLILESPNHKLQTLIKLLKIPGGTAHRALDDARACLGVGLECLNRLGPLTSLREVISKQGKEMRWENYQILKSNSEVIQKLTEAISKQKPADIAYEGGSAGTASRRITPKGIVRNPDGDYVMALCHRDGVQKRFYIQKIKEIDVPLV